jgi:hypothetical protein
VSNGHAKRNPPAGATILKTSEAFPKRNASQTDHTITNVKRKTTYTKYMLKYEYPTPNDRRHLLPNTALTRMLRKKA